MLPYHLAQLPFITQANIHDNSTRTQIQLRTNKPQHEHARYCVRNQVPEVVNSASIHILTKINTHTQGFSKIYQTYHYTILRKNYSLWDETSDRMFVLWKNYLKETGEIK